MKICKEHDKVLKYLHNFTYKKLNLEISQVKNKCINSKMWENCKDNNESYYSWLQALNSLCVSGKMKIKHPE